VEERSIQLSRSKLKRAALLAVAVALIAPASARAQPGTVEEITIQGLSRMTQPAFMHRLGIKEGDPYDVRQVRRKFKELWELGIFEDITALAEAGTQGGTVLIFKIKERPVLTSVTYEDNKVATRTQIEDRLKEREISLRLGKPLDLGTIFFVETAIRDLMAEKGYLDAEVEAQVNRITETTRGVNFRITPGGKTRIRDIEFVGNEVFSDRRIKSELELTKERQWYWPWSSKSLYHPVKWDQDVSKVREMYLSQGYLDVEIGAPRMEVREGGDTPAPEEGIPEFDEAQTVGSSAGEEAGAEAEQPGSAAEAETEAEAEAAEEEPEPQKPLTKKEQEKLEKEQRKAEQKARKEERDAKDIKRWVYLTIPIREGPQYTLGEISVEGNEVFPDELLRALIPLAEGGILNNDLLEASVDRIRRLYEDRGHLYATVVRRLERHEGENVADVVIVIEEDEPYYVAKIEFRGNTSTYDKVLRREMILMEGDLFSRTKLDVSKAKVNQLGYFEVVGEPVVEPVEGENRINVIMSGEERGRNEIQVGGGYSGLDGAFFNGVYSTRNFLGRGQIVSVALQIGGRSNRYSLSFQEPWFMNRPYLLGLSLYRQSVDYGYSLQSESNGIGVILGRRIGRWGNLNLSYNWRNVTTRSLLVSPEVGGDFATSEFTNETRISSITPVYTVSSINNPYRPSRGRSYTISFQIAGGPLGGDTSYLKPVLRYTRYTKAMRKTFLGIHAEAGWVREWQGGSPLSGSNIEGVPRFERFWLGGDTHGPRVFETRTITPRRYVVLDEQNRIVDVVTDPRFMPSDAFVSAGGTPVPIEVGGDRFFLIQAEYVWPLNEQAEIAAFLDVGDSLAEDQNWGFETARVSAGVEVRFHLPIFPVPLRLIYGWPLRAVTGDRVSNFTFSIGRSF
jgi:outer membrane protein assembly complex protein YaeT